MPESQTQTQTQTSLPPSGLLENYTPPSDFYDEWKSAPPETKAYWDQALHAINTIGLDNLRQRDEQARRIIQSNGITYNVYADDQKSSRPWMMDLLPLIIASSEMQRIEEALNQRVHLLNLILQDLYGRQMLLRNGSYPPRLVFGNPAYLRPCHHLIPPSHRFLNTYTADLARSPDGTWWVLSDRLDAASGLGYSIENRYISTRVLPEIFRSQNIKRLNPFIRHFCQSVERLSPRQTENPLIVLLTPGSWNETYFEQVFLARTLGYPLVEGADLTVRNHKVYLKTTNGLQQVDVIIRRLDSDWCDPLELRSNSLLGIPGLINAIRQGNIAVMNTPGCGLLESPATMAFLPSICRNLLGEDLKIPSVATWWCGHPKECTFVLENLAKLVIKPTFRTPAFSKAIFGPSLSKAELTTLTHRIKADPALFTAQEIVARATTPVFENDKITPRHFLLRLFAIHPGSQHELLMPGGLGRTASPDLATDVSMQHGGSSKDVWIIGNTETRLDEPIILNPEGFTIRRSPQNLPSRTADDLFWLGRYCERTDSLTRALIVILRAIQESTGSQEIKALFPFIGGITPYKMLSEHLRKNPDHTPLQTVETLAGKLIWDAENSDSLHNAMGQIHRISHTVKERISGNTTQVLSGIDLTRNFLKNPQNHRLDESLYNQLSALLNDLIAFSGTIAENTTRGQDWYFLDIGRRIERSITLINALSACLSTRSTDEEYILHQLLSFADSTITYRRRYLTHIWPEAVADLLITDPANPRSIAFQVSSLKEDSTRLPHYSPDHLHPLDRKAIELYSLITLADIPKLLAPDSQNHRPHLIHFEKNCLQILRDFSDLLSKHYFSFTAPPTEENLPHHHGHLSH